MKIGLGIAVAIAAAAFATAMPGSSTPAGFSTPVTAPAAWASTPAGSSTPVGSPTPVGPSLAVEDVEVGYAGAGLGASDATVTYTLRNTGDTVLSAQQVLSVTGPFGVAQVDVDTARQAPELLPGETWTESVPVEGVLPLGQITAVVTAVPIFTDAAGSTGPLTAVDARGVGWAVPWIPLVVLGAAIAVAVIALRRRATRQRPEVTAQD